MLRIPWELEECVALMNLYFDCNGKLPSDEENLRLLSNAMLNRAKEKGFVTDEKFRNITGLKMQFMCIHYVVTNGKEGFSRASKLFYDTYELYKNDFEKFNYINKEFENKYFY